MTVQSKYNRLFADIVYSHRNGYYGRKSQYSASHEQHHGDNFALHLRYDITQRAERLVWVDLRMATERLTSERENYRRTIATNGTSAIYYEYFEPTKWQTRYRHTVQLPSTPTGNHLAIYTYGT